MMQNKTVVITGATSGLGEAAALNLAKQGARIVFVARDKTRADATLAKLKSAASSQNHKAHLADFSSIADIKRIGAVIAAEEPRIDILFNNAGALLTKRVTTEDGLELTFAVNHMAYFVLTQALLANIIRTPGARIVSTASSAHAAAKLDFDDLQSERIGIPRAYGLSKLCNILFTRELARRLAGTGVVANCFHPGFVASRFGGGNGWLTGLFAILKPFGAVSNEQGADTGVWLASSPETANVTGGYYARRKLTEPTAEGRNDANAKKLWDVSEAIAARAV